MFEEPPGLSAKERQLRQEAVDYAIASLGLSGFKVDAAMQERARLYVEGQLLLKEFVDN